MLGTKGWHSAYQSAGIFACVSSMNLSNGHIALQPAQQVTTESVATILSTMTKMMM